MILVRQVLHGKFGKGAEIASAMRENNQELSRDIGSGRHWRVLTDLSGDFDTVVLEFEVESLAEWEQTRQRIFASQTFRETFDRTVDLVMSGRSEFYTIEGQG